MAREKLIRAYTTEDLSDFFPKKDYKIEYAHPRFFKSPKKAADFVFSNRQYIIDAYEDVGIPAIYADEKAEEVEPEVEVEEPVQEPEAPVEDDAPEAKEESEEESDTPDIEAMNAAELKAYAKDVTGKVAKTKAEALDLLKGE